jgi:single-strand DNA-binding protein
VSRGGGRDAGADFVWISAWDRQGELCAEYLGKGRQVGVEGRLKSRTWEQDGRRRDAIEIVARRIDFLGGGPRREDDAAPSAAEGGAVYRPGVGGFADDASSPGEVIPFEAATV